VDVVTARGRPRAASPEIPEPSGTACAVALLEVNSFPENSRIGAAGGPCSAAW